MKGFATCAVMAFLAVTMPANAEESKKPLHMLPATDEDLKTLDAVVSEFPKLCLVSDNACIATVRLRALVAYWQETIASKR